MFFYIFKNPVTNFKKIDAIMNRTHNFSITNLFTIPSITIIRILFHTLPPKRVVGEDPPPNIMNYHQQITADNVDSIQRRQKKQVFSFGVIPPYYRQVKQYGGSYFSSFSTFRLLSDKEGDSVVSVPETAEFNCSLF